MYAILKKCIYIYSIIFYKIIKKVTVGKNATFLGKVHIKNGEYIRIGENTSVGYKSWLAVFPEYNGYKCPVSNKQYGIYIGDRVKITQRLKIYCADSVYIDDDALIASEVFIADYNHGMNATEDYSFQPLKTESVYIGKGTWIGEKVCILPGVHIGEKSIIAAGSIVTHDVPDYVIAAGNPAKIIKKWDWENNEWIKVEVDEK